MLNYLARLGWSHGDDEIFSLAQMVQWFDGSHLSKSPAQWDRHKLAWVNGQHLKQADDARLARLLRVQFKRHEDTTTAADALADETLAQAAALFKDRCNTVAEMADALRMLVLPVSPSAEDVAQHVPAAVRPALLDLATRLADAAWDKAGIAAAIKATLAATGLKMPQLAPAVRVWVCGRAQTPSIDAVLALFARHTVLERLRTAAAER
jgi:glutamyl-tRNA synthetase